MHTQIKCVIVFIKKYCLKTETSKCIIGVGDCECPNNVHSILPFSTLPSAVPFLTEGFRMLFLSVSFSFPTGSFDDSTIQRIDNWHSTIRHFDNGHSTYDSTIRQPAFDDSIIRRFDDSTIWQWALDYSAIRQFDNGHSTVPQVDYGHSTLRQLDNSTTGILWWFDSSTTGIPRFDNSTIRRFDNSTTAFDNSTSRLRASTIRQRAFDASTTRQFDNGHISTIRQFDDSTTGIWRFDNSTRGIFDDLTVIGHKSEGSIIRHSVWRIKSWSGGG